MNILFKFTDCLHSNKELLQHLLSSGEVMFVTCLPVSLSTTLLLAQEQVGVALSPRR